MFMGFREGVPQQVGGTKLAVRMMRTACLFKASPGLGVVNMTF